MGVLCSGCQSYRAPQCSADLSEPGAPFPCPPEGGEDTGGRRRVSRSSGTLGTQPPRGSLLRQEWGSTNIQAQHRAWGSLPVGRVTEHAGVSLLLRCPLPWTSRRRTLFHLDSSFHGYGKGGLRGTEGTQCILPPATPSSPSPLRPLSPLHTSPAHGQGGEALPFLSATTSVGAPLPPQDGMGIAGSQEHPLSFWPHTPPHPTLSLPLGAWGPLFPPSSLPRLEGERPARDADIQSSGMGADPGLRGPIFLSIY